MLEIGDFARDGDIGKDYIRFDDAFDVRIKITNRKRFVGGELWIKKILHEAGSLIEM